MANILRSAPLRKDFWTPANGLDDGIFVEAAKKGMTVPMFLEDMKSTKQEPTIYAGLTKAEVYMLKKEMKAAGKEPPATAFEECLEKAGIKAWGSYTDPVSKFFEYSDTDVLFPVFVSEVVHAGLLKDSLVPEFAMSTNVLPSEFYQKIYLEDTEDDRELREVGKAEEFPETKIVVGSQSIRLVKYGRYIKMAYEDIAEQRINVFGAGLARIGLQIQVDQTDDMVYTMYNGDGNSNTPETTVESVTSATFVTEDVIGIATGAPSPYKYNKFIGRKALLQDYYLSLSDFDNPVATWGFMGIDLPRAFEWDRSVLTSDRFLLVDTRYAIEHLTMGATVLTETEKMIRQQCTGTAVSHRDAFSIFDHNALGYFDGTH